MLSAFVELPSFSRERGHYLDDDEFQDLQQQLAKAPELGDVIVGTGGVRKLRWRRSGMGKRGGLRVIYYHQDAKGRIWLLSVYAKNAQDNISTALLNKLRTEIDHAEAD